MGPSLCSLSLILKINSKKNKKGIGKKIVGSDRYWRKADVDKLQLR